MADLPDNSADLARVARLVDFETTGVPEDEQAEIVEAAKLDVDLRAPEFQVIAGSAWSSLIKPTRPIPPETSAVHHIVDADVAEAPLPFTAWQAFSDGFTDDDVYVAHKADFEQHFYSKRPQRWICTYKCALRAWPAAPGFSNQVLRYWLKVPVDRELAMPPHRALPDCYVTAGILRELLQLRPIARLVEISGQPGFLPKLLFGKHRGSKFTEAPSDYLQWLVDQPDMDPDVVFTARYWLKRREAA